jgi:hypothetical protein
MSEFKGFTQIPNAIMLNENISANAKITYATLLFFDRGRGCWAKKEFLSKRIGLSKHLLRNALIELVDNQLINITKRHHGLTDIIRVNAVKVRSKAGETLYRSEAGETLNKKTKENLLEEELAPKETNKSVNNSKHSKHIDDRNYKEKFRGIHGYNLYNNFIQKTDVDRETDNQVVIATHLKQYQREMLLEYHKEDLENLFKKEILMR